MHDLLRFDGKTIVLTGAASGIGAATLELLNKTDADVHAVDLAPIAPGAHTSYQADLGDPASITDLTRALPAGVDALRLAEEIGDEDLLLEAQSASMRC